MSDRSTDLRNEICQALAESSTSDAGEGTHPGIDSLIAYHGDNLNPAGSSAVADHLVACAECRELVLDLEDFVCAPLNEPGNVAELGTAAAWRDLQPRLAAPRQRHWPSMAAALAVVSLGLGLWSLQQRSTIQALQDDIEALSQPYPGVPILALSSGAERSAPEPAGEGLAVDFFTVLLVAPAPFDLEPFERFEATVLELGGSRVWRGHLPLGPDGLSFTIGLSRRFLPKEDYTIVVDGLDGEKRAEIGRYRLRLGPAQ